MCRYNLRHSMFNENVESMILFLVQLSIVTYIHFSLKNISDVHPDSLVIIHHDVHSSIETNKVS